MPDAAAAAAIRPARPDDYPEFARLFRQLEVDDPTPDRASWERDRVASVLIAERGGATAGYAHFEALQGVGYVRNVVVDAPARGAGLGRALMEAVAARLRAAGCERWCLNVKPGNKPAVRLYESCGMALAYRSTSVRLPWSAVARLPRTARATAARPVAPEDDDALETAFELPRGQLAGFRAAMGNVLLQLAEDGAPVGVARFAPAFPGAFPFRVASPDLAAELLTAIRAHALPEYPHLNLVIEDDDALARTLIEAGAEPTLEFVHMRGPIPAAR